MKPAAFIYHRPSSLQEALATLAACAPGGKLLAGGQSLGPMLNMRLATPPDLIDLNDLTELSRIRDTGKQIEIGALTRHYQIAESRLVKASCPLLAQAAGTIGHYAIRQRGTLGGSLAHADPSAQLPLIAATLGATLVIASSKGERTVAAADFFKSVMSTSLLPDEIIRSVNFPKVTANEGTAFRMFNRRHGDYAIVAVAATVSLDGETISGLRIGLCGVSATPMVCTGITDSFLGESASEGWAVRIARAVREKVAPEDDERISALYRKELTEVLVERALLAAYSNARAALKVE